jgi:outer membrane protein assembly factor BamB
VNWGNYNSAEATPNDNVILQNDTDIIIWNAEDGRKILDEREHKGFFAQMGSDIKKQTLGPLSSKNDVQIKYWHQSLTASHILLLFDRSTDSGTIRSIDARTGKELWSSESLPWNLEKFRDEADYAVNLAAKISFGSAEGTGIASSILLQDRAIKSMVKEIPQKNAFLFKTADGLLSMIDSRSGNIIWKTRAVSSTGLASVKYIEESDELLLAGDMGGLKDIIESADVRKTMKQVYRLNAENGKTIWASKYKGREDQVDHISIRDNEVLLYFTGGSLEFFDYTNGKRQFGTRDEMGMEASKVASAVSSQNTMETNLTSMPIVEGDMVYAINPTGKVNAFSLDDKQLVKYNYKTGEEIWKSPVLEKVVDIRDMKVSDELVIIRIPGAGNMLGKVKHSGIYAFDKKTGKQRWQFTESISKDYVSNLLYRSSDLLTGDGNTIYRLSSGNGNVLAKRSFEEPDIGDVIDIQQMAGDTTICVIGGKGLSIINADDLTPYHYSTVSGHILTYQVGGDLFIGKAKRLLSEKGMFYAFSLRSLKTMANFTLVKPDAKIYGNLYDKGYVPINHMKQVLTINETGIKVYNL